MVRESPAPTTDVDQGGATTISSVHPDVLLTHILSRLDGSTLASTSCASSQFHTLSTQENLWSDICHSTWHSTLDPRMRHLISTFPNGPRSFFSDSFPLLSNPPTPKENIPHRHPPSPPPSPPPELISAVDLHYKNKLIFSKVQETQTLTNWFRCSPFRIDLLDPKDVIPTSIHHSKNISQELAENLTLSWIIVDPIKRRAANVSSWRPVSVQRHWLSGEIQVRFATILGAGHTETTELVQCGILVAFGGCEDGADMLVREVSLQVEDMDGINLNGKDSLEILQVGIERGERKKGRGRREETKERYEEYLRMKKEREQMKLRRERRLDSMCIAFGISFFTVFSMFFLYR